MKIQVTPKDRSWTKSKYKATNALFNYVLKEEKIEEKVQKALLNKLIYGAIIPKDIK